MPLSLSLSFWRIAAKNSFSSSISARSSPCGAPCAAGATGGFFTRCVWAWAEDTATPSASRRHKNLRFMRPPECLEESGMPREKLRRPLAHHGIKMIERFLHRERIHFRPAFQSRLNGCLEKMSATLDGERIAERLPPAHLAFHPVWL